MVGKYPHEVHANTHMTTSRRASLKTTMQPSQDLVEEGLSEGERLLVGTKADDEDCVSLASLVRRLAPVACKGFVVGAGLHVGQVVISGVVSRKLLRK